MTLELHPLCTLFPRLSGAEFNALRDDIKANGLRQPIVLHGGLILDGGNRYRACVEAGIEPVFTKFSGGNLVSFVLSANLHRRHMTAGQQAAIVASAQDWAKAQPRGGDRKSDQSATLHLDRVQDRAAESGASIRTQKMADKVAKADPALAVKVAHGEVSLPKAHASVSPRPVPVPTTAPKQTVKEAEAQRTADDAHGDLDPVAELESAMRDIEALTAQVKAAEANDLKAEAIKWRRAYDHACRQQSEAMDRAKESTDREKWVMRQLMRCGKAVGQEDPTKIAAAVEAVVRQVKVAA